MDNKSSNGEKSKDPNQLLLIIAIAAAVVSPFISTLVATNSLSVKINELKSAPALGPDGQPLEGEGARGEHMAFYEPMEFLVNLADADATHYLRTTVSLGSRVKDTATPTASGHGSEGKPAEGPRPELFTQIKAQEPVIRDVIISVISAHTMTALISSKGKNELKEMIKTRLQQQMRTDNLEVYFTAFTLQ